MDGLAGGAVGGCQLIDVAEVRMGVGQCAGGANKGVSCRDDGLGGGGDY